MTLKLYNTKTRHKDEFKPIDPENVRMYVCGPTVYDFAHIGNARPVIVFDVLFRLLRHVYGESHVTYARNITDIDDKIMARAARNGQTIREVTEETTRIFHEDVAKLGTLPPTIEPRATETVDEMVAMIGSLINMGHAYEAEGHVLFSVSSMADYGKLSGRSVDDMIAGARVEVAPYKRDPMDFVLWKPSEDAEPGWDSPWGRGRPGWHLECSAMIEKHLGETIDIHGGGIDLVFPHHENEIAQSKCAHHGAPLANVWMHNGFLQVEGEKMSKSLGNFHTIHDLLGNWSGEALRLHMLMTHYRQPIDWTEKSMEEADETIQKWQTVLRGARISNEVPQSLVEPLLDDLNTPGAIKSLHDLFDAAKKSGSVGDAESFSAAVNFLGLMPKFEELSREYIAKLEAEFLNISGGEAKLRVNSATGTAVQTSIEAYWTAVEEHDVSKAETLREALARFDIDPDRIQSLVDQRTLARKAKDFAEADRIRDELDAMGIDIMDSPEGTTWKVAK